MIRAVFFDAAETLIYLPGGVGYHYRLVAARHGVEVSEGGVNGAFRVAFRAGQGRKSGGPPGGDDDKEWWRTIVRAVFTECGHALGHEPFQALFDDLYAHFAKPGVWQVYAEARPLLEKLRGRFRLGLISNFDRRLYPVLEDVELRPFFEVVALSSELGIEKPDRRIFQWALDAMGVTGDEALHVGDQPEQDWRGAAEAGLHVFQLRRPENSLHDVLACLEALPSAR